jgi:hypothetical protein
VEVWELADKLMDKREGALTVRFLYPLREAVAV